MRIGGAAATDVGLTRTRNEDCVLAEAPTVEDGFGLFAVADGMGGQPNGDDASRAAVRALKSIASRHSHADVQSALTQAFSSANQAVRGLGKRAGSWGAGTTLVVAVVRGATAWVANVGDSRAYLVTSSGWTQITLDHSWAAENVRAGVMTADDGERSSGRHILTRHLGASDDVATDVFGPFELRESDRLVLCSDGLYSVVDGDEIAGAVRSLTPSDAVRELIRMANARGGPDNTSVIVAALSPI